jgi:DICT domain-containing protein
VFTAFNPAHLFEALEAAGFETKTESLAQLSVSKKLGNKLFKLEGVSHYLQMVQEYFFSEGDIIAMLHELEDHVRRADPSERTRIDLFFEQRFSRQPARGVLRPAHHAESP